MHSVSSLLPPIHDEIRFLRYIQSAVARELRDNHPKCRSHLPTTNERRVPQNVIRLRPFCPTRIGIAVNWNTPSLVWYQFTSCWAFLEADAIPDSYRLAILILHWLATVIFQQRISMLNIVKVLEHGVRYVELAMDSIVPLQM